MPFDFNWQDQEHTIIRLDVQGDVAWSQLYETLEIVTREMANTPNRVDVIFNNKVAMPPGNPMPHLKAAMTKMASFPNMGLYAAVNNNTSMGIVKTLVELVMRAYRIDMSYYGGFYNSLEAAVDAIAKDRAKKAAPV